MHTMSLKYNKLVSNNIVNKRCRMTNIRLILVSTLPGFSHFNISLLCVEIVKPLSILLGKSVSLKTVVGLATLWAAFNLRAK